MLHRNFLATVVLALALAPLACGGGKPKDKTADDATAENVDKTPPPALKCESLDDKCKGDGTKVAKVKSAMLVFVPPKDWTYAVTETHSIMQASAEPNAAVLVIGSYAPDKDAKKNDAARDAAFDDLGKAIGTTLPKGYKVAWKKAEAPMEANGLKMGTWLAANVDRAGLKDKKGSMPIVHAPVDAEHNMIAIGFVLEEDEKGLGAIQNVLTSIKADEGDKKP
jgi:hypothetical protein